jgi:hypothetical protein
MSQLDIQNRFSFHPATTDRKRQTHEGVRSECRQLAMFLEEELPYGREKDTAMSRLEEVMFWANAAVARPQSDQRAVGENQP